MVELKNLIGILLVTYGSRGDKLLFRFPLNDDSTGIISEQNQRRQGNPYVVSIVKERSFSRCWYIMEPPLEDDILASLLSVNVKDPRHSCLFDLKIGTVRFVGCPVSLIEQSQTLISAHVLFVLHDQVDDPTIETYQMFSRCVGTALRHEQKRCGYLDQQRELMMELIDKQHDSNEAEYESPYLLMLTKSRLAKELRSAFENIRRAGTVDIYINEWTRVNFCLPARLLENSLLVQVAAVAGGGGSSGQLGSSASGRIAGASSSLHVKSQACLSRLRPYLGLLLLTSKKRLLEDELLPVDASPALLRLVSAASHTRSLQQLAADTDLSLSQVFELTSHLVYWAKAIVIYPISEANTYVIHPSVDTYTNSALSADFAEMFPHSSWTEQLVRFSTAVPLAELCGGPLTDCQQRQLNISIAVWMLRQRLIVQLHRYITRLPVCYQVQSDLHQTRAFSGQFPRQLSEAVSTRLTTGRPEQCDDNNTDSTQAQTTATFTDSGSCQLCSFVDRLWHQCSSSSGDGCDARLPHSGPNTESGTGSATCAGAADQSALSLLSSAPPPPLTTEDVLLLTRLIPYINHQYHIDAIQYYENLQLSPILTLLDKLRHVLVTCYRSDPATIVDGNLT